MTRRVSTDAIVRLTASAICGTDLHVVRGSMSGMKPGTILGHGGVGIVESSALTCATSKSAIVSYFRRRFDREVRIARTVTQAAGLDRVDHGRRHLDHHALEDLALAQRT
jgi:hypothetical protein